MNALTHRGYAAVVEFDPEDMILTGRIAGIRDRIGFHAETAEGIAAAFREAVDDYLDACSRLGKRPERSYSGKVMFRVRPELHARIAAAAELSGQSLNQWGEAALEQAVGP
jgi:predicted HicB family RNase H-like nuclease